MRSTEDLSVGEGSTEALVYNVDGSSRSPWQLFSTYRCLGPMPSLFFFFFCYLVYKYSRGDSAVLTKLRSAEIIVAVLTEQFEVVPGSLLKITH